MCSVGTSKSTLCIARPASHAPIKPRSVPVPSKRRPNERNCVPIWRPRFCRCLRSAACSLNCRHLQHRLVCPLMRIQRLAIRIACLAPDAGRPNSTAFQTPGPACDRKGSGGTALDLLVLSAPNAPQRRLLRVGGDAGGGPWQRLLASLDGARRIRGCARQVDDTPWVSSGLRSPSSRHRWGNRHVPYNFRLGCS